MIGTRTCAVFIIREKYEIGSPSTKVALSHRYSSSKRPCKWCSLVGIYIDCRSILSHCVYIVSSGIQDTLWAKLVLSILDLLCFFICGLQTHFYSSIGVLLSKDIPSPCRAGGIFTVTQKGSSPLEYIQ